MPLRKIEEADLDLMLSWRNHPSIRQSMFSQVIIEPEQHRAWFRRQAKKEDCLWLIYETHENRPAGIVYFTDMDRAPRNAFWGFYAAPDAQPGTGTRMGLEAIDLYFSELGFHKLNAEVLETNERSLRFHRKLGFKVEGVFQDQYLGEQAFQSVTRFGLLAAEWDEHRKVLAATFPNRSS
ncbi:UDP-4-amino-4,6-dideoxy-N-acetyl-beta-L-altrosamine N-acetyltransferase [Marinobacter sediminum]|uniref:UDP-4-amino-4, 6-dideoxy-N-acetyl-beta-L-altrosamine N-acetyltransferase n=1 Tax=Marinobacter sediminum TaxID=256323 RepID=UPI00193A4456|nr:UDP-4-amino-4,6-dideoxy-N-acetyl-beta-L-altrosamine N-acetyltransferase [Marinobacter sediminum]